MIARLAAQQSKICSSNHHGRRVRGAAGTPANIAAERAEITIIERVAERRHGERQWVYLPVLVYGRTIESEPFHEGTEALRVNAGGGLITLTSPVRCGQRLLLINKVNQKEHECHVVAERSKYLQRTAVVVGFEEPAPDFWST